LEAETGWTSKPNGACTQPHAALTYGYMVSSGVLFCGA